MKIMNRRLFKVVGKVSVYVAGVLLLVFLLVAGFGAAQPSIKNYLEEKRMQKVYDDLVAEQKAEEEALRNDTYGGSTPEETLDMLIAALEAGDVELAARYDVPTAQKASLSAYKEQIEERGNLDFSISYIKMALNDGKKNCGEEKNRCSFSYEYITQETSTSTSIISRQKIIVVTPAGMKETRGVALELNPFTNVWKITR